MKKELYILLSSILLLFSCAEEGPYRLGKMECNIETSMITQTTSLVKVSFSNSDDNVLEKGDWPEMYIIDHPLNKNQSFNVKDAIEGMVVEESNNGYSCIFERLSLNTTYFIVLYSEIKYNEGISYGREEYYYTDFSFSTSNYGDYSGLGKVSCEVVQRYSNGYTGIKVTLPTNLEFYSGYDSCLVASTNPDMSNYITSHRVGAYGKEYIFEFNDLPDGIYYLQLDGHYQLSSSEYRFNNEVITLDAETTLDLTQ